MTKPRCGKKGLKPMIIASLKDGATVSSACEGAGINRDTFYTWYKKDPAFAKQVEYAQESRIQHVEDALYKNAIKGNLTAQIFYLCNRAPQKWRNVQNIEHSGQLSLKNLLSRDGVQE